MMDISWGLLVHYYTGPVDSCKTCWFNNMENYKRGIYYLLTYLLTPWSRVLLEKLTGFQLVKKFPAFYGTRRFITASWASLIQSIPPHPMSWRSILILSSHLRMGLPSGLFPSGFPTKTRYTSPPPYALHALPISFFSILSPEQYWLISTDH